MKKVLSLLLSLSLVLLTTECKVSNMEPIPPNSTQITDFKLLKEVVYQPNVYVLDVGKGNLDFLPNNIFTIVGDYTIKKANAKIEKLAKIPDESTVIINKNEEKTVVLKISDSVEISGGYSYKYESLPYYAGFKQGAIIYKETTVVKANISTKQERLKIKEIDTGVDYTFGGELSFTKVSIKNEEYKEGKLYSGREEVTINWSFQTRINLLKDLEIENEEMPLIRLKELPSFVVPGLLLKVSPSFKLGIKIEGKCSLNGSFDFIGENEFTKVFVVKNGNWVLESDKITKEVFDFIPSASVNGVFKIGPLLTFNSDIYKLGLSEKKYISAGGLSIEGFAYTEINLNCSSYNRDNKDELNKLKAKIMVAFDFFLGRIVDENNDSKLANYRIEPIVEFKLVNIPSFSLVCKEFPDVLQSNFGALLKSKSFPIYEGDSPPSLTTPQNIFLGDPTVLFESTLSSDDFNKMKNHGYIKFQFINQQGNTIKVETKRNTDRVDEITLVNVLLDKSVTAVITGKDGKFTVIGRCVGRSYDKYEKEYSTYVMDFAISGEKVDQAVLQNVHYAFKVTTKLNDPHNEFIPEGAFRYFKVRSLGAINVF